MKIKWILIIGSLLETLVYGQDQISNVNPRQQAVQQAYNSPIDFWGKVVDQDGKSIAGVTVTFTVFTLGSAWSDDKPKVVVVSDAKGLFSLTGKKGIALVISTSKEGYDSTSDQSVADLNYLRKASEHKTSFHRGEKDEPFPTQSEPTVFVLTQKK
jgi:hypothetical protein